MRRAPLALLVLMCTACMTMNPRVREPSLTTFHVDGQPVLCPFAEGGFLILKERMVARFGEGADSLVVAEGFVSDLASIPPVAQSLISKLGPHIRPAIVHDYLYWTQPCTRDQADAIFSKMLKDLGTPLLKRVALTTAVSMFGKKAWQENARQRAAGLPRTVPPEARDPHWNETWPQFRAYLLSLGVKTLSEPVITDGFCTCSKRAEKPRSARAR